MDRPSSSIHSNTFPRPSGADDCHPVADDPVDDFVVDFTRVDADRCKADVLIADGNLEENVAVAAFLSLTILLSFFFLEASSPNIILMTREDVCLQCTCRQKVFLSLSLVVSRLL